MNIRGNILEIFQTNQIKETFRKREFVVEYAENPNYPQILKFEMINDNCSLLDNFAKGDDVEIDFDLRGREWTNPQGNKVYFVSLNAFRLKKIDDSNSSSASDNEPVPGSDDVPPPPSDEEELPF
ncbi:MAG: DUF3127 domain-containing protein [Ignavibacteria bacterium]|nr:DUF3127 domain-containing protein [Ignavibacteria bacterium]